MVSGRYKHPAIKLALREAFFQDRHDLGPLFYEWFNPVSLPTIAFIVNTVCGNISGISGIDINLFQLDVCLDDWKTGVQSKVRLSVTIDGQNFSRHLANLKRFHKQKPEVVESIQTRLWRYCGYGVSDIAHALLLITGL